MIYTKSFNLQLFNPTAILIFNKQRIAVIVRENYLQADTQLMQIAHTLNLLRFSFGLRNCREQKRGKNSYDGDDDQQFRQRERRPIRRNFLELGIVKISRQFH